MNISDFIKEAKNGSAAAQKYLFDEYAPKMLMICRRYVKNNEDAEELMLTGFYRFFKKIIPFNYAGEAALFGWLKKIMIHECLMFLRKKNVFIIVTDAEAVDVSLQEEALDNLFALEIFNLIIQLPVGYRTVFNLYEIEGMQHKEIADILKISEGTSKSQLSKAKALLKKMLEKNNVDYARRKSQ